MPFVMCAEIWGGPFRQDCFCQFNPPNEQLHADLETIGMIYHAGFEWLIREQQLRLQEGHGAGKGAEDTTTITTTARERLLGELCEAEGELLRLLGEI